MTKMLTLNVQGVDIALTTINEDDYICITDMIKAKDSARPDMVIQNWMRTKDTIEFLGLWEILNNPDFKPVEFEGFRRQAGLNRFSMTPKLWIETTGAIGIRSKPGRNGGTFAHKDIAFEFASWISPAFKLYLIKEYQRLVSMERSSLAQSWDVKRLLTKTNYQIHTDAIKNVILPKLNISQMKQGIIYATEADILNLALFGCTAKQWQEANPELAKKMNVRDTASINQLVVLANLESLNAEMIKQGLPRDKRLSALHRIAKEQLSVLISSHAEQNFRRLVENDNNQKLIE